MPKIVQISRLVGLVLGGLVLTAFVDWPNWTLPLIVLDSPLTLRLSSPWLIAAVLAVLVSAGTDLLLRLRPATSTAGYRHTAPAWALPSVMAAAAPLLIVKFEPFSVPWLLMLVVVGLGLALALAGEWIVVDPDGRHVDVARTGLTALTYAVALVVFTAIYSAHVRTVLSGSATTLVSFLLAVSLLRWPAGQRATRWPYAAVTAVTVGLATWGLNRAALDGLAGGGLLLLVFYVVTGVAQQVIQRDLSRRVVIEFAVAVGLGLLLLIGFAR